jgi:hypothetical protein
MDADNAVMGPWTCDMCRQAIRNEHASALVWRIDAWGKMRDFRLVHGWCDVQPEDQRAALHEFVGAEGLARLLDMLSAGPIRLQAGIQGANRVGNLDHFVDVVRRLHTPYYEGARRHFASERLVADTLVKNDVSENTFGPRILKQIGDAYE